MVENGLTVFGDVVADMESNKNLSPIIKSFLRGKNLDISLVFISQSYFNVPETIRLNATHYFIVKIPNKRELQQKLLILMTCLKCLMSLAMKSMN